MKIKCAKCGIEIEGEEGDYCSQECLIQSEMFNSN